MSIPVLGHNEGERFALYHADCVEVLPHLPPDSVGLSVYSPPFAHLFVYSASERDMGNVKSETEFLDFYRNVVRQIYRMTKPGRLTVVHCSDLPRTKQSYGYVGLYDFPAGVREIHEQEGWTYHSRVTIRKSPVVEMTRTKALGLLHKQLLKDSCRSRVGMPDYLLIFRKTPADEKQCDPVSHAKEDFPVERWQEWAEPVWMDIDQTNVLNVATARSDKDERHVCPLQLDLIERAIVMWSNPGDVVLSPFAGIGSEGVVALKAGRRFVGVELKESYFKQAARFLGQAEAVGGGLFTGSE